MRILNLITALSGGGAERQLQYLASELAGRGHSIHVAYLADGPWKGEWPGVQLHVLRAISNYDPGILLQVVGLVRSLRPDIIQTWNPQMDVVGGIAAWITGAHWVLREANSMLNYSRTMKRRLRVRLAAKARAIVSNSRGGDDYWSGVLPGARRHIVPNGLPLAEIRQVEPNVRMEQDTPILLYAGRLEHQKRVESFLAAVADVSARIPVRGVVCGEGRLRPELEAMTRSLGLAGRVLFKGHVPPSQVWGLMKQTSALYSPSRFEGAPNAVMEAMVCGCPVVVSDIQSHREMLDEDSAYFVDPSDVPRVASIIEAIVRNPESESARVRVAARRADNWAISATTAHYERIYRECAA